MVFSKQFQQGETVGIFPNKAANTQFLKIYFIKGIYVALIVNSTSCVISGKEFVQSQTLLASNNTDYLTLTNGFSLSDLEICIKTSSLLSVFALSEGWHLFGELGIQLPTSGYIEPVSITAIDDPLLAPILAYCVRLRKLLQKNGIAFPGLEGVNF